MSLLHILRENRTVLAEKWLDAIFRTYPLDTVGFMRRQTDQFANPVRHRTEEAVHEIVDALLKEKKLDTELVQKSIDEMIRVRAVQTFTASRAVGIIYLLKQLVREMVFKDLQSVKQAKELLQFESKIDVLALIAFDNYCDCREQIHNLRVNEVKNSQASLLRRAKMVLDTSAEEPDPTNP